MFRVNHSTTATLSTVKYRPSHIPDYLPDYPDPHTFLASETYADLRKDYGRARQTLAEQRRALQRSLVKFKLQTTDTIPLLNDSMSPLLNEQWLLIKSKPSSLPYLTALLPHSEAQDIIGGGEQQRKSKQPEQRACDDFFLVEDMCV